MTAPAVPFYSSCNIRDTNIGDVHNDSINSKRLLLFQENDLRLSNERHDIAMHFVQEPRKSVLRPEPVQRLNDAKNWKWEHLIFVKVNTSLPFTATCGSFSAVFSGAHTRNWQGIASTGLEKR